MEVIFTLTILRHRDHGKLDINYKVSALFRFRMNFSSIGINLKTCQEASEAEPIIHQECGTTAKPKYLLVQPMEIKVE